MLAAVANASLPDLSTQGALATQARALAAADLLVDVHTTAIQAQPPFTLAGLPNLGGDLGLAQRDSRNWSMVKPQLIQLNSDLIDYANSWNAFSPALHSEARDLATGDNKAQLINGLSLLTAKAVQKQANALSALAALRNFQATVDDDRARIAADRAQGNSVYGGDSGRIAALEKSNADLQRSMERDLASMAYGATDALIPLVVAIVAVPFAFVSAPAYLIIGGLALEGVHIGVDTYSDEATRQAAVAEQDYYQSSKLYVANLVAIAQDTAEIAFLSALDDQIDRVSTAVATALSTAQSMADSWQALVDRQQALMGQLQSGTVDSDELLADITVADGDWNSTRDVARHIQDQATTLPVQESTMPAPAPATARPAPALRAAAARG